MARRWRSPKTVAIVLAVLGIVGAVLVYRAGGSIRESDRAEVAVWRRDATPHIGSARAASERLPSLAEQLASGAPASVRPRTRTALVDVRRDLQRAREAMLKVPIPRVAGPTAAAYFEAIARSLDAVSALQDIVNQPRASRAEPYGRYSTSYALATRKFEEGGEALAKLEARLAG
jgi:type II secretory pathway pseudopilin PulG